MTTPSVFSNDILSFVGFFFAGLAVNLTPCVYPMLTVTASLFEPKSNKGEGLKHSFTKALSYFFGIVMTYSSLGYFAASTGKLFGSALQNSWVLLAVAMMMFVLATSMFGLFQLRLPSSILSKLGGANRAGYLGLFISGMLVGVFAAPCMGPAVLVLLTTVTQKANPTFGLWAFFIFSLGLGLPYLILGTFSGLISRFPKSGHWLKWIEHSFGVILIGFGFFYLSLSLHSNWHDWVWPICAIVGGIYLGFIEKAGDDTKIFKRFKNILGIIVILLGFTMLSQNLPSKNSAQIHWTAYSQESFETAKALKKPIVIDFYAEWCAACHELDQSVFSRPAVIEQLSHVSTLRVDATNVDDPNLQKLLDHYEILGLPTVIFLDAQGQEIADARVVGFTAVNEFIKSLKRINPNNE